MLITLTVICNLQDVQRRLRALEDVVNDLKNSSQSSFNRQLTDLTNRVIQTQLVLAAAVKEFRKCNLK